MALAKPAGAWTYDDLFSLPDDGTRYEIIEGELYEMPPPNAHHAVTLTNLLFLLGPAVQAIGRRSSPDLTRSRTSNGFPGVNHQTAKWDQVTVVINLILLPGPMVRSLGGTLATAPVAAFCPDATPVQVERGSIGPGAAGGGGPRRRRSGLPRWPAVAPVSAAGWTCAFRSNPPVSNEDVALAAGDILARVVAA